MRKSLKEICSCVFIVCCLMMLSACGGGGGGGNKTFGEVSKGLTPPNKTYMNTSRFFASLPEARQKRLSDMVRLVKEKGDISDIMGVADYGIGAGRNKSKTLLVDTNNEQVSFFRAEKGQRNVGTVASFKFYEIKLPSDYILPSKEADINIQEIKLKPNEVTTMRDDKNKEIRYEVFQYCEKNEFESQAFYVVSDKLYLAVPYFGKVNENNEVTITVFLIEPTEFEKINQEKVDKSYENSNLLRVLIEDYSMLILLYNGPFCSIKENQGIRDEYEKWQSEDFRKRIGGKSAQNANVSKGTESGNKGAKSDVKYTPVNMNLIQGAYHSSALKDSGNTYHGYFTLDGNLKTCWAEGVPGLGIGEKVRIDFKTNCKVNGLNIWTGYQKSEDLFYKNSRPIAIRVMGSDGSSEVYQIEDKMGKQRVDFKQPILGDKVSIVIEKVAKGSKFEDTCITEIDFF